MFLVTYWQASEAREALSGVLYLEIGEVILYIVRPHFLQRVQSIT